VGYGAGAWMMSQLERYGEPTPHYGGGLSHCGTAPPTPDTGGDTASPAIDAGPATPNPEPSPPPVEESPPKWDDGPALICAATQSSRGASPWPALFLFAGVLLTLVVARRGGHHA